MSRIVDADKVRTIIVDEMWNVDDLPHDEQQAVIKACYSIWERIEKRARTEKVIPVEWIEKKCRELYEHLYLDESLGVQMLLRDWEKENQSLE